MEGQNSESLIQKLILSDSSSNVLQNPNLKKLRSRIDSIKLENVQKNLTPKDRQFITNLTARMKFRRELIENYSDDTFVQLEILLTNFSFEIFLLGNNQKLFPEICKTHSII